MINKLRLLALSILTLGILSATASVATAADTPTSTATAPAPAAKKASVTTQELCGGVVNPCRVFAFVYTDAYYKGYRTGLQTANHGDCDASGYTFYAGWGSNLRATSSIARSTSSPRCNAVTLTNTLGVEQRMCIPRSYVGAVMNDVIAKIQVWHSGGC